MVVSIFRADLRVTSKAKALEFYEGVKHVILIPFNKFYAIRVEPNNLFGIVSWESVRDGTAQFRPNVYDDDGKIAYNYRKYINAYLRGDQYK